LVDLTVSEVKYTFIFILKQYV